MEKSLTLAQLCNLRKQAEGAKKPTEPLNQRIVDCVMAAYNEGFPYVAFSTASINPPSADGPIKVRVNVNALFKRYGSITPGVMGIGTDEEGNHELRFRTGFLFCKNGQEVEVYHCADYIKLVTMEECPITCALSKEEFDIATTWPSMNNITEKPIPGFYMDQGGRYGIVLGGVYICCFVDVDDATYNVTVDGVDEKGAFARNISWDWYFDPSEAIKRLYEHVKKYCPSPWA